MSDIKHSGRICFDLDGTLCHTRGMDYKNAKPIPERIAHVVDLWERGWHITIDTARAPEHFALTADQLFKWAVPYHVIRVGDKVPADIYVDDRAEHADDYFGNVELRAGQGNQGAA